MPLAPRQTGTAQHVSTPPNSVPRAEWPQANSLLEVSLASVNSQTAPRSPLEAGGLSRAKTVPRTSVMLQWCRQQLQLPAVFPCPVSLTNIDIVLSGIWDQIKKQQGFGCHHTPSRCKTSVMNPMALCNRLFNNSGQAASLTAPK